MQRLLALILVLIGVTGLVLGRLGETTWAPATETTATVDLSDAGPAVVIDPGVLYVGGEEGELVIEGASDISVITAGNDDIAAYLDGVHYTRITGASDWTTLSTEDVNPDGAQELSDPTSSDLWRSVDTAPSPYTLDVNEFWTAENSAETEQPYRALLIVTDGTEAGAEKVSITWPVDAANEWVPFAYAGGAAIAVVGLVLLVVSLGGRRRNEDEELEEAPQPRTTTAAVPVAAGAAAGATGATVAEHSGAPGESTTGSGAAAAAPADGHAADDASADDSAADDSADAAGSAEDSIADGSVDASDSTEGTAAAAGTDPAEDSGTDFVLGDPVREDGEKNVWSWGEGGENASGADDAAADTPAASEDGTDRPAPGDQSTSDAATSATEDRTEQIDVVDDEEGRR